MEPELCNEIERLKKDNQRLRVRLTSDGGTIDFLREENAKLRDELETVKGANRNWDDHATRLQMSVTAQLTEIRELKNDREKLAKQLETAQAFSGSFVTTETPKTIDRELRDVVYDNGFVSGRLCAAREEIEKLELQIKLLTNKIEGVNE